MADTGWISPGSALQCFCGGCTGWSAPSVDNCKTQNDTYATADITKINFSTYIKAFNFTFGIPAGSTIVGIETRYDAYGATANIKEALIKLMRNCVPSGNDKGDDASIPTSDTDTYKVDGGGVDMWGSGYGLADITNADFGVMIQFYNDDISVTRRVNMDHIQMKIYYTPPGYAHDVNDVPAANIGSVNDVPTANIETVNDT